MYLLYHVKHCRISLFNLFYFYSNAKIYHKGIEVSIDDEKAYAFIKRISFKENHFDTQEKLLKKSEKWYEIALSYEEGLDSECNISRACDFYKLAAKQGNRMAKRKVRKFYTDEYSKCTIAWEKAESKANKRRKNRSIEILKKANIEDEGEYNYRLGYVYFYGDGADKDLKKAYKHFSISAKAGYASGQYRLALMYYTGDYLDVNMKKTVEWLSKASEQGHVEARYRLEQIQNDNIVDKND